MQVSRRQFFKICAGGMAGTTAAALGFAPSVALAETRQYKLLRTRETRNTCTYCSVGCGLLMYSLGDGAKKRQSIYLPYRRRSGSPGQPRCTLSERRWPGGFHPLRKPSEVSGIPCARF